MERFFLDCPQLLCEFADNKYVTTDRRLSIAISPEVAAKVQKAALDFLAPYDVASTSPNKPKLFIPGETYLDIHVVKERLNAILADGRVDPLESYGFYKAVAGAAGPDAILQDAEARGIEVRLLRVIAGLDPSDRDSNAGELMALAVVPIQSYPKIFEDSDVVRKQAIDLLNLLDSSIAGIITITQEIYSQQKEREHSYFNFVSAENAWGMSSWFTPNGEPPSVARMRGTYKFLRELQDHQAGLDILRTSIQMGVFPEDNAYVKKFLNGPFPVSIGLREFLIEGENRLTDARIVGFARQLVQLAMSCDAEDMAVLLAKIAQKESPEVQIPFDGILPSAAARFVSGPLTSFANSSLSLHHILMYVASAGFGKLLAAKFSAAPIGFGAAVVNQGARLRPALFALPGIRTFGLAASGEAWFGLKGMRVLGNFGAECVKWAGYTTAGHVVAGYSGLQVGSMVYIGLLGGVSGWLSGKLTAVGLELTGGGEGGQLGNMLASGTSESGIWRLVREATQSANMRSFRLAPSIPEEGIAAQVRTLIRDISKSERTQEQALRQLEKLIQRSEKLVAKNPERLGESFLARIRDLAKNPDPVVAAREVRAAVAQAESSVSVLSTAGRRASRSRIPADSSSQGSIPGFPRRVREVRSAATPPKGVPWRNRRPSDPAIVSEGPPSKPPVQPVTPQPTSLADLLVTNPPEALTEEIVTTLGRGRIQFTQSAWKETTSLYNINGLERGAFLRRLKELGESNGSMGNEWKSIQAGRACYEARAGIHYRILVKRVDNGFQIYRVATRGSLDKGGQKVWAPPKS